MFVWVVRHELSLNPLLEVRKVQKRFWIKITWYLCFCLNNAKISVLVIRLISADLSFTWCRKCVFLCVSAEQPQDPGGDSQFPAIETTVHHYSSVLLTAEGMSLYSNNQFFNDMLRPRVTHYTHLLGSQVDKSKGPKSEINLRIRDQEGWASLSFFTCWLICL